MVKRGRLALVIVGIAVLVGGYSSFDRERAGLIGNDAPAPKSEQPGGIPDERDIPEPVSSWTCTYDVTYNDDWHDDVVCSNGSEAHRPSLREWDDFVTEAELMESAREYAAELNLGG